MCKNFIISTWVGASKPFKNDVNQDFQKKCEAFKINGTCQCPSSYICFAETLFTQSLYVTSW